MLTEGDHDKMRGFAPEPTERMTDERLAEEIEVSLLATTDAKVWAEAWYRIFQKPDLLPDGDYVGWMIGWFANAFAAQEFVDAKRIRELQAEVARLKQEQVDFEYNASCIISTEERRAEAAEAKLRAVVSDCAGCFRTAAEDIQDWGDYADAYFQKKHGLKSDVARYRNKADELEALLNEAPKS